MVDWVAKRIAPALFDGNGGISPSGISVAVDTLLPPDIDRSERSWIIGQVMAFASAMRSAARA